MKLEQRWWRSVSKERIARYSTGTFIRQTHLGEPFISQMPDFAYCIAIDRSQRTEGRNRRPTVKAATRGASHTAFVRKMVKIEKLEGETSRGECIKSDRYWIDILVANIDTKICALYIWKIAEWATNVDRFLDALTYCPCPISAAQLYTHTTYFYPEGIPQRFFPPRLINCSKQ